jgi:UDP-galactopyranose mutase
MEYDFLIVGAGLFGAVFAQQMTERGKKCLVIEKRNHIAGNCYTELASGINVHMYGAHIFHTSNKHVWDYINKFSVFNNYVNSPIANYKGKLYNLPFNMNTFYQMWGVITPEQAKDKIAEQVRESGIINPRNLEEQSISLVGNDIYEKLVKGYTEKQWGRNCKQLPKQIITRLPVRFTYDNNYFSDRWQGVAIGGYTQMVSKMLEGVDVELETDYFRNREFLSSMAKIIVYTGPIDAFFGYCYGALDYRRVYFETEIVDVENYKGVAVMNYTDRETPYTRIIEHKHFEFGDQSKTVISREYPVEWFSGEEPYYSVNDQKNNDLYSKYQALKDREKNVIFGGRLAEYRYYDMDKVIASALGTSAQIKLA